MGNRHSKATMKSSFVPFALSALLVLAGCATQKSTPPQGSTPATTSDLGKFDVRVVAKALAPSGTLRAAINFGNPILAKRGQGTEPPSGISVDIAKELGARLGVPVQLVTFEAAGKVVDALKAGSVDLVFVAIDPVRGADVLYSAPYVIIEGSYLVPKNSPIQRNDQVDAPGNRIVVGAGSAYDLFLIRELKKASLVRANSSPTVVDKLVAEKFEVAAGVRQQLEADAKRFPGVRMLEGRFMQIDQAVGVPKTGNREEGLPYLRAFVEELKRTGFMDSSLKRHKIEGAAVPK
jgi:polar amino acid transport system substrate-binding protein